MNEAFATELSGLIRNTAPSFWIYGHHHGNTPPFTIGKTKLLNNQVGYVHMGEHRFYKAGSCFEVASSPGDGAK